MGQDGGEQLSGSVPALWVIAVMLASGELTWWLIQQFLIR